MSAVPLKAEVGSFGGELHCVVAFFLVRPTHHDLQHIIPQRPLQRLRLIPCNARIQTSRSSSVVRITGIAFGWIGSTMSMVRKP